jgi:hypothetical protein
MKAQRSKKVFGILRLAFLTAIVTCAVPVLRIFDGATNANAKVGTTAAVGGGAGAAAG